MNNLVPKINLQPINYYNKNPNSNQDNRHIEAENLLRKTKITGLKDEHEFYQKPNPKPIIEKFEESNDYFYKTKKVNPEKLDNISKKQYKINPLKHNFNNEIEMDAANFIRGGFSRADTAYFQKQREQKEDMRLQYLNKNFQDPNKLVMPFPRGGDMTREKYSRANGSYKD